MNKLAKKNYIQKTFCWSCYAQILVILIDKIQSDRKPSELCYSSVDQ